MRRLYNLPIYVDVVPNNGISSKAFAGKFAVSPGHSVSELAILTKLQDICRYGLNIPNFGVNDVGPFRHIGSGKSRGSRDDWQSCCHRFTDHRRHTFGKIRRKYKHPSPRVES